jgi:NADP-dependent 3-hydroxy acid dehydrogenase YdfG
MGNRMNLNHANRDTHIRIKGDMTMKNKNSANAQKPVWFITGCSTGFGRDLAKHVLELGYRTVVTARKPDEIKDLATKGAALVLKLDVTKNALN